MGSKGFGRRPSLLEQENSYSANPPLSRVQSQVDGLVSGFVREATDWRSLAAMTAGGTAYRIGRMGVMGLGTGKAVQALSLSAGLIAEVSAFEISHRAFQSENPQLWKWSGHGGLAQGLLHSFIAFGTLKGAGRISQGQNIFFQHLLQDSAMVAGHQASGWLGAPPPTGTLAEQFLKAEATNLQMGAGMALAQGWLPGLHGTERMEAEGPFERKPSGLSFFDRDVAFASPLGFYGRALSPTEKSKGERFRENSAAMSSVGDGDGPAGGSASPPPRVSRTIPPRAPAQKEPAFTYQLLLNDFSNFQTIGHESVIAVRDNREFSVKVGHREKTKRWDRYFPAGTTKLTFQLREGNTQGKAVVYLEHTAINLYSISNQASQKVRKMLPGAGTIFLDWLATQAALQGKEFNIIRVENTHIVKILSRSGLVDPEESMIEACLWDKGGYRVERASRWEDQVLVNDYDGGRYNFLNIRARPNRALIPPPSEDASN